MEPSKYEYAYLYIEEAPKKKMEIISFDKEQNDESPRGVEIIGILGDDS